MPFLDNAVLEIIQTAIHQESALGRRAIFHPSAFAIGFEQISEARLLILYCPEEGVSTLAQISSPTSLYRRTMDRAHLSAYQETALTQLTAQTRMLDADPGRYLTAFIMERTLPAIEHQKSFSFAVGEYAGIHLFFPQLYNQLYYSLSFYQRFLLELTLAVKLHPFFPERNIFFTHEATPHPVPLSLIQAFLDDDPQIFLRQTRFFTYHAHTLDTAIILNNPSTPRTPAGLFAFQRDHLSHTQTYFLDDRKESEEVSRTAIKSAERRFKIFFIRITLDKIIYFYTISDKAITKNIAFFKKLLNETQKPEEQHFYAILLCKILCGQHFAAPIQTELEKELAPILEVLKTFPSSIEFAKSLLIGYLKRAVREVSDQSSKGKAYWLNYMNKNALMGPRAGEKFSQLLTLSIRMLKHKTGLFRSKTYINFIPLLKVLKDYLVTQNITLREELSTKDFVISSTYSNPFLTYTYVTTNEEIFNSILQRIYDLDQLRHICSGLLSLA